MFMEIFLLPMQKSTTEKTNRSRCGCSSPPLWGGWVGLRRTLIRLAALGILKTSF